MSLPRYAEYKDSGVEWLGDVPAHWEVKRLKHNLRLLTEKTERRTNPIALENIKSWSGQFVSTETEFQGDGVAFERDDILFGKLRPYLAKVLLAHECGEAVGDFHVMRPTTAIHPRFAQFSMLNRSFIDLVDGSTFGSKMPRASWDFVGSIEMATPSLTEQTAIATFLDRETAKIDALISEQEKLLTLLAEKRQATISHAVTKGLNPDAPMKDSCVAWLGDIPEHWEVLKGSRIGTLFGSGPVAEDEVLQEGPMPFIKVGSLSTEGFEIATWNWYVSEATAGRFSPYSEFIVFPKRGAAIFLNKVNIVRCRALIDPNLMGWKIRESTSSEYVAYVLTVRKLQELADVSTVPQINNKHIEPEKFPMPPRSEQVAIVGFLAAECRKLDLLKTESERAITLLRERRSALIAAAVTGQIDVRGLVPQPEAA